MKTVKLGELCDINPKDIQPDKGTLVSFIPMQRVSETGQVDASETRQSEEVSKGFSSFREGDILMAKITPCMENGKGGIAKGLCNGIGYGSTEFHVIRPTSSQVRPEWIYYYTINPRFRKRCEQNMTGSAGQKRVPKSYLFGCTIPVPCLNTQDNVIHSLNTLRSIIQQRNSLLAKLDELVKCRFVEMFGEPVANPMGWATKSMHEVAPHSPIEIKTKSNDIWLLNLDKIESHTGRVTEYVYVPPDEIGSSTCGFDNRHVLYSKLRPYLNKVVVPKKSGMATSELLALLPNEELNREFLAHLLRSDNFVGYISEKVSGAKMPRVSMDIFRAFPCIVPPMPLQNAFDSFVRHVDKLRFTETRKAIKRQKKQRLGQKA